MLLHLHMSHLENEIMKNRMTLFSICIALLLPPFSIVQAEELVPQNSAETQEQEPGRIAAEETVPETSSENSIDLQETLVHAVAGAGNGPGQ